ncbi:hypothetical protein DL98DRAFT_593688 [Cadophora sp. DSE1049]|nr:hypothetical protein DL98DRAFT_593688 [Cadophora sp. DSE1049]
MGPRQNADAWRERQSNKDEYDVFGPYTMNDVTEGSRSAVRVFMGAGQGNINLGDTAKYASAHRDLEFETDGVWSGENGVVVAYVTKKKGGGG